MHLNAKPVKLSAPFVTERLIILRKVNVCWLPLFLLKAFHPTKTPSDVGLRWRHPKHGINCAGCSDKGSKRLGKPSCKKQALVLGKQA